MGYQLSITITEDQQQFLRDNVNKMSVAELCQATGIYESKMRQTIRLMDLNDTEGQVESKEGIFNVYEYENWIM